MPKYEIRTPSGSVMPLGTHENLDAVYKLRIFKNNPSLKQYIHLSPVGITARSSNRWAYIPGKGSEIIFLSAYYASKQEVLDNCPALTKTARIVRYPKDHYHPLADETFNKQLSDNT